MIIIYCVLFCSIWIVGYLYLMWSLKRIPFFHLWSRGMAHPEKWPRLSIIIPACNEEEHIESAIQSLIAQDYPELEIIIVNDRSTDNTGDIIDRLASVDDRIKPVHIDILPTGWLGKLNAMHQGVKQASGEWLLFTDADIHFSPGILRRSISFLLDQHADHLALMPKVIIKGFWLDVAIRTFGLLFFITTRVESINRPNSKAYIGIGAFNLVSRDIFNRTSGFEWLRLEPGDDVGLGMMVKQAGGVTRFALADEDLSLGWYPNVPAMFKGLEKNLFGPGAHYQWWRMTFQVVSLWALVAAPVVTLYFAVFNNSLLLLTLAALVFSIHIIFSIFFIRERQSETFRLLLFPIGVLLVSIMMLYAGYKCIRNNGIDWRGTHYPLEKLRQGQRVKF